MAKRREIRNSTAEFLIFQAEAKEQGVEVYYKDENIWATQKAMATLFDVNVPAISKHLKNIFESGELKDDAVVSKMEITASDGKRYQTQFYSLDAIIAEANYLLSTKLTQNDLGSCYAKKMLTKPLTDCLLTFHLSPFNKENKNGK